MRSTRRRAPQARHRCSPSIPCAPRFRSPAPRFCSSSACARCATRSACGSVRRPSDEVASPRRAFLTSAAATASNPLTIASWAAVFAAASGVGATPGLLVIGVGAGSLVWVTLLATGTATARRALGERAMRAATRGRAGLRRLRARAAPSSDSTVAPARSRCSRQRTLATASVVEQRARWSRPLVYCATDGAAARLRGASSAARALIASGRSREPAASGSHANP